MLSVFAAVFILSPACAAPARKEKAPEAADGIPVRVQYLKTGQEEMEAAEKLGQAEVDNSNPCVLKMKRDLESWARRPEILDASRAVTASFPPDSKLNPVLVLRYMNEAIELRFELRSRPVKDIDGTVAIPAAVKYRRGIFVSSRPGTWRERVQGDVCHVTEPQFQLLVDEVREADRLESCIRRKKELVAATSKIVNYIHNYLPATWIEEARQRLTIQRAPIGDVLRENQQAYLQGNATYKECARGLRLLEEEAGNSVRVLQEVKAAKQGTEIPGAELEALDRKLKAK